VPTRATYTVPGRVRGWRLVRCCGNGACAYRLRSSAHDGGSAESCSVARRRAAAICASAAARAAGGKCSANAGARCGPSGGPPGPAVPFSPTVPPAPLGPYRGRFYLGEIVRPFLYRGSRDATVTVSRSGIARQVRPIRPPGGSPRLGAGPHPVPAPSSPVTVGGRRAIYRADDLTPWVVQMPDGVGGATPGAAALRFGREGPLRASDPFREPAAG
jgi:hypothetical protein